MYIEFVIVIYIILCTYYLHNILLYYVRIIIMYIEYYYVHRIWFSVKYFSLEQENSPAKINFFAWYEG